MRRTLAALWDRYGRPLDRRAALILVLSPVLLLLWDFHGRAKHYRSWLAPHLAGWPLSEVYERVYFGLSAFVLFFLVPALVVRFAFRERLGDYGLALGDWRTGLRVAGIFLAVMVPLVLVAAQFPAFRTAYPQGKHAAESLAHLALYEAGYLVYFVASEFLFRGFMLFGLERALGGGYAVLVQMIPFAILHLRKPEAEALGAVLAGIALGVLGLETRSCWYAVLLHFLVALTMDLAALAAR